MYVFKSEQEEQRFAKSLNDCIEAFKKRNSEQTKSSERKLKKAVDCNLNLLRVAQLNHRQGTDFYTYELYLVYKYLDCLYESGLYEFEEWELDIFRR